MILVFCGCKEFIGRTREIEFVTEDFCDSFESEELIKDESLTGNGLEILYVNADGFICKRTFAEGERIFLDVEKACFTPVVAFKARNGGSGCRNLLLDAEVSYENDEMLYGTVYPCSNVLSSKDLFAANVLMNIYECVLNANDVSDGSDGVNGGVNLWSLRKAVAEFNWNRFVNDCRELDEIWVLDRGCIMKKIVGGTFSVNDLKLK